MIVDLIRSRATLEAEIWVLRQQINVLRRKAPKKLSFQTIDRLIFVGLYRFFPGVRDALASSSESKEPFSQRLGMTELELVPRLSRGLRRLYLEWLCLQALATDEFPRCLYKGYVKGGKVVFWTS